MYVYTSKSKAMNEISKEGFGHQNLRGRWPCLYYWLQQFSNHKTEPFSIIVVDNAWVLSISGHE